MSHISNLNEYAIHNLILSDYSNYTNIHIKLTLLLLLALMINIIKLINDSNHLKTSII